jgi:hypothetical protein
LPYEYRISLPHNLPIAARAGLPPEDVEILAAAGRILRKFAKFADSRITKKELQKRETTLKKDLDTCIGQQDQTDQYAEKRITRYNKLATKPHNMAKQK